MSSTPKTTEEQIDEILRQFLKDFRDYGPINPLGVARDKLSMLLIAERAKARVSEAAWWTRNYRNPDYAELLEHRLSAMRQQLNTGERDG